MEKTISITMREDEFQSLLTNCFSTCFDQYLKKNPSTEVASEPILFMEQAAELLGVSIPTIYGWINKNIIPHYKPAGGKLYFIKEELIEWVKKSRRKTTAEIKLGVDTLINNKQRKDA